MKKKVLICGASGFIGRNLFETLTKNNELDVVGTCNSHPFFNPASHLRRADLTDKASVDKLLDENFDVIIQAAATTSGAKMIKECPEIHVTDNVVMNSLIFRSAFHHNVSQVIFFSCSVMYSGGEKPLKETDLDLNGGMHSAYLGIGWTKIYLEKMCEFYSRLGQTKFLAIRHSNTYGPYDKYDLERSHMFGANVTKVMTAKEGDKITVWGTGQEKRDLVYVSDVVSFVELALAKQNQDNFDLVNVGCGKAISVDDIISKIIIASGKNLSLVHSATEPTIPVNITLDSTKARDRYDWQPKVSLDAGISKTIDWYRKNIL